MNTTITNTPRVYVGTYAKYNNGSIDGAWVDLEECSDKETFISMCEELHKDEEDPELMFQDWENVPTGMISECHIDEEIFAWLDLDDDEKAMFAAYRDEVDGSGTMEQAQDAFAGTYDSPEDYAQEAFAEETSKMNYTLQNAINWESVVRELECDGYTFVETGDCTYVFHN
jgi:antirestriction protein